MVDTNSRKDENKERSHVICKKYLILSLSPVIITAIIAAITTLHGISPRPML